MLFSGARKLYVMLDQMEYIKNREGQIPGSHSKQTQYVRLLIVNTRLIYL